VPLLEQGALDDPKADAAFALHIWNSTPAGQIAIGSGPVMAAADEFSIKVVGRGGHGSQPQATIDPVVAASHIVTALQSIVNRNIDPLDPAVLTVATIHGGTAHNVIPAEVELGGTIRSFRPEVRETLVARLREVAESVCHALGARAEVHVGFGYPVTGEPRRHDRVRARRRHEDRRRGQRRERRPVMGAEDFSYFLKRVPVAWSSSDRTTPRRASRIPTTRRSSTSTRRACRSAWR
jgi:amidohydrolase